MNRHQRRTLSKAPLWQVNVETRDGKVLAIGPKQQNREACERLVIEINRMIIQGRERVWANPHIVPMPARL